jgi:hypothetical protein
MKISPALSWIWRWIVVLAVLAMPAKAVFAQDTDLPHVTPHSLVAMSGLLIVCLAITLVGYVYMALALQTIANKTKTENAWLAWIPIVNIVLMLNIGRKPLWWLLLLFIPLANIVIGVMVWMAVAEARGKPGWWGIVVLIPVVGIIVPGYLAWSD